VWEGNFDEEFNALLRAVSRAGGPEAILAMDMEFPGFLCQSPRFSSESEHHQALCCNVDQLWPIQLGIAVAGANGMNRGVWTFNLRFDANVDAHTEESLTFLRAAGIDFPRHRTQGINALTFGRRLADSSLVGAHGQAPSWLTFSGSYDWGYLLKLVSLGRALPSQASTFDKVLSVYCPKRLELRDLLPTGSLEVLGRKYGVQRWGTAHTAGSDALLTLELFVLVGGPNLRSDFTGELRESQQPEQWTEVAWGDTDEWYPGHAAQWYAGGTQNMGNCGIQSSPTSWEKPWGNSTWTSPDGVTSLGSAAVNNDWYSSTAMLSKSPAWHTSGFQPWAVAAW